jgi:GNAT superfamily N-acetyltransferase
MSGSYDGQGSGLSLTPGSHLDLLRRLVRFELDLQRRSSAIVERFEWGELILNPRTSALWSDNFLSVADGDLSPTELKSIADELLGARGLEHRFIVPADTLQDAPLEAGFWELGWEIQRSVYMVLARQPDRAGAPAREVHREEVESVRRAVAEDDPDLTREAVEERPIRDDRLAQAGNGRWFAAPADGPPGAACVLYEQDGVGQVETVVTTPALRGRGLASGVVLAAARASSDAGHELTFIVADAEDWPWKLYERLGFDPVGEHRAFLRKPVSSATRRPRP